MDYGHQRSDLLALTAVPRFDPETIDVRFW